jgi:hypothetical protein
MSDRELLIKYLETRSVDAERMEELLEHAEAVFANDED